MLQCWYVIMYRLKGRENGLKCMAIDAFGNRCILGKHYDEYLQTRAACYEQDGDTLADPSLNDILQVCCMLQLHVECTCLL